MAVSLNCHNKPLSTSLHFQNPNFSSSKYHRKNQNHISAFRLPAKTKTHRIVTVRGLGTDSDPNTPQEDDKEVNSLGVRAALSMLSFYKREISPLMPRSCRYVPTCSEYSMQAYKKYGVVKGTVLTAWRLCRCNPLGAYVYSCMVKAKGAENNRDVLFGFTADYRKCLDLPIPMNYFGNCVGTRAMVAKTRDFMEETGVLFVAEKLSDMIKELEDGLTLEGFEEKLVKLMPMMKSVAQGAQGLGVIGSNRFDAYKSDFG
ncbi:hypothetical protein CICLE_v10012381mg [Citrus x clementina]|uniref:Membrane protein insertion efficiency factor YidD n=1 Tax=Citrus clementina TaxID=85681 RepID=V4US22_CITCL|nr:UPF0161 protein At3g09310 [Citrus sinensis]ESR42349.1 hypothetical protein CICLE_v10012381mg [Citrus x clementina]